MGVVKAYTTRVGAGPFPTEDESKAGEIMAEKGYEYGTTTGRRRRCGWLDLVLLKYAKVINGLDSLALTKLDVLSPFKTIKVCVAYEYKGKVFYDYPPHQSIFHHCTPVYKEVKGWECDISQVSFFGDLPQEAQDYVKFIEKEVNLPVEMISVGPARRQTIFPYGKRIFGREEE